MSMPKRDDEIALWAAFGTNGEPHRWPRDAAVALGIPYGRAEYLCVKWSDKGVYDYGTAAQLGWKLDEEQLQIRARLASQRSEEFQAQFLSRPIECERCDDMHWVDDPTACGDPDHCNPTAPCPDCNPTGDKL